MKYFRPIFKGIKKPFKILKIFLKQKAGWLDVPKIVPYKGYGNGTDVFIQGMVIEDKGLAKPKDRQHLWENIIATLKRFSSDEIPDVRVRAKLMGQTAETKTDELGYFSFHFNYSGKDENILTKNWQPVHFELLDEIVEEQPDIYATGEVRVISPEQPRVIVSDIDDTAMVSHSTQAFRKLRLMLLKNARTRHPFPGASKFYQALSDGKSKQENNPFFFVSSSEWNLYDLLDDFFNFNRFPKGVFLLRRLENSIYKFWKSGGGSHDHKFVKLRTLLDLYPEHSFILIGDSGQQDPAIYTKIALEYPGRIDAIYIRRIRSKSYLEEHEELYQQLKNVNTSYLEVQDTHEAAIHAAKNNFVAEDIVEKI
ncbi:MAG TPA: phosphatase domain-containing protein [Prolixibacteraceae bacterium]|nr:phosphatase domain-containing protein [Prolixibacteraceae bacterium]